MNVQITVLTCRWIADEDHRLLIAINDYLREDKICKKSKFAAKNMKFVNSAHVHYLFGLVVFYNLYKHHLKIFNITNMQ